jgi:hypothetical protein
MVIRPTSGHWEEQTGRRSPSTRMAWLLAIALLRTDLLMGEVNDIERNACSTQALEAELSSGRIPQVSETCVIITSNPEPRYAIARCFEWMRRCGCLREKVILLSLVGTVESRIIMEERLEVIPLGSNGTFFVLPHNIEWEWSVAKSALSRIRSRLNGAARREVGSSSLRHEFRCEARSALRESLRAVRHFVAPTVAQLSADGDRRYS